MARASRARFTALRRSLAAQLVAFTLIVLVLALIFYVLAPLWQMQLKRHPLASTRALASQVLFQATETDLQAAMDSPDLAEIAAANPGFYYYVRHNGEELQFGEPPRLIDTVDLSVPVAAASQAPESGWACESFSFWNSQFTEHGMTTNVAFLQCDGRETYYEYGGIVIPLDRYAGFLNPADLLIVWIRSRELLMAALAFMVIAAAVRWAALRSLRRVTRVAHSIDPRPGRSALLPEDGIPTEAAPLVRAVNELIRRLRESQEQQGLFLAAAAHEMRTPLAVLRTRLEELPESETKGELREDTRRIVSLVEQLLRLAIIRNRDELSDEVDLADAARTVVAQRAPLSLDRGVEIELEADRSGQPVRGDRTLVEVAIANLLDNAVSVSPAGERVTVGVAAAGVVTVRDRGPGIAGDVRETIFEPFSKSPPNRDGHGLGLAIVKAVMSLHGGEASVAPPHPGPRAAGGNGVGGGVDGDGGAGDNGAGCIFRLSFRGGDGPGEDEFESMRTFNRRPAASCGNPPRAR